MQVIVFLKIIIIIIINLLYKVNNFFFGVKKGIKNKL